MASPIQKPPMDAELRTSLSKLSFPMVSEVTPEIIKVLRTANATPPSYLEDLKARGISHREIEIPSHDNSNHEIILSILQPISESTKPKPCIYWIHGGGFHWGDRLHTLGFPTEVLLECDAVCVSVEYRLAPESPFSVGVEDCYSGLKWTSEHTQELGIDPKRILISGTSAGGGLVASTVLLCRDRQEPEVCGQCLICPALDDRLTTVSSHQFLEGSDFIPRGVLEDVWKSSLGANGEEWKTGIVPASRAEDLSGLPPTLLDVGSAEVMRDEAVVYASKLWASGVQAELYVWAGGFHGFDMFFPNAAVSKAARNAKIAWVKRIFRINSA
ncbi:esterase LipW [Acephala macrosclerotiorum]|nr:esterase LipW [Acephala macrosclerotiorum]